jgi:thymidylate synthase ThyX
MSKDSSKAYTYSSKIYDDGIGSVDYVSHMGSDLTIVNSARVSFGVEKEELNEKDRKLITYLIRHRHTSTLEHCLITFRFCVPLFVRSQHHRHRTWSYKFIDLRKHMGAQWEIQRVAEACLEIATDLFPETMGAYQKIKLEEG